MEIAFIGDPHNDWDAIPQNLNCPVVAVGDMSLGVEPYIIGKGYQKDPESFGPNFHFIRGNHDSPKVARAHKQYLGEFGVSKELNDLFFISGAFSHDKPLFAMGPYWHEEEQLSREQLHEAIDLYEQVKPNAVVSHECPVSVIEAMKPMGQYFPSRTAQAMDRMLELHKPERWIFGHHHRHLGAYINGTHFVCLDIGEVYRIEV